jgi:hypothetical protein
METLGVQGLSKEMGEAGVDGTGFENGSSYWLWANNLYFWTFNFLICQMGQRKMSQDWKNKERDALCDEGLSPMSDAQWSPTSVPSHPI